ncbi:hypothetical protein AJ79_09100 [Helicocarpus griseus UAMH5409]|uniref:C2H2-type domain-containing protein n=1 Tax=Helicocarpus griseus UAMH5409 TaxID=1447875 RepID=A0A2B7WMH6_9EURO|nr:hypothetical protein AJ79_09100 [Helicocarpus griseus UAMH5409]
MSTSTTEKRYICPEAGCGRAFFRSEHLGRHRLNHRPKQVFQCPLCPKEFVRRDLLHRHEKRHEKGMWYRNSGGVVKAAPDVSPSIVRSAGPSPSRDVGSEDNSLNDHDASDSYQSHGSYVTPSSVDVNHQLDTTAVASVTVGDVPMNLSASNSVFSDSSNDIIASSNYPNHIDWLFEGAPLGVNLAGITDFNGMPPNIPSMTPFGSTPESSFGISYTVTNRLPVATTVSASSSWSTVKDRLQTALYTLPPDVLQSSFFYPTNLSTFYDLYFINYHPHFPIFHRPTLNPVDASPLLIAAIVTLGSTLGPDENHFRIATRIHNDLRWLVFATGAFEPPAPLWCLQTLLIIQAHEKMFSTRKHHEMAHIFHGAIITLMKRGTAYTTPRNRPERRPWTEVEVSWCRWITDEGSRRTAFFAFIMDAQHAFMFGHSCTLAPHEVQLPLPCSDHLWEQPTAIDWARTHSETPESPRFLPTLKGLLSNAPVPANCSSYSRLILLHGIFSITAHLHARVLSTLGVGQAAPTTATKPASTGSNASTYTANSQPAFPALPAPPPQTETWKTIIERAINTWAFCLHSQSSSIALEACKPLHHMSRVAIHTNIIDFHVLAGAAPLLDSSPLSGHDITKAAERVRAWSRNRECKKVLYHCLLLVQETLFTGNRYVAKRDNIALRPWCLYHATLVLWAYGRMCDEVYGDGQWLQQGRSDGTGEREAGVASSVGGGGVDQMGTLGAEEYLDRMLMLLKNTNGLEMLEGASQTLGLILRVRESLEGCRWELLQEAYGTLGKLIGA